MFSTGTGSLNLSMQDAKVASNREATFRVALTATIPQLRTYGRSLSGNIDIGEDLIQDTMARAWVARDRFIPGTNILAWTRVILRNVYFSQRRRARFSGECRDFEADRILAVPAAQEAHIALGDLARALQQLPAEQREALLLMGAGGLSCEGVAEICNCATGTVKSRVTRGRIALRSLLEAGTLAQHRADVPATTVSVLDQLMHEASRVAGARAPAH